MASPKQVRKHHDLTDVAAEALIITIQDDDKKEPLQRATPNRSYDEDEEEKFIGKSRSNTFTFISPSLGSVQSSMELFSDDENEDSQILAGVEAQTGIEFDQIENPPIYAVNGEGIVVINDSIECRSGRSKTTTFQTNIMPPKDGKYYFEIFVNSDRKLGIGIIDKSLADDKNKGNWVIYIDELMLNANDREKPDGNEEKEMDKPNNIIGVSMDINELTCIYYLNGVAINEIIFNNSFNLHSLTYNFHHSFILQSHESIQVVAQSQFMRYYTQQFKAKGYDTLQINKSYFQYKKPVIGKIKMDEKELEEHSLYPIYDLNIDGNVCFYSNLQNGLKCRSPNENNCTFVPNFKFPSVGKYYFEVKIEQISDMAFGWISVADIDNNNESAIMYYHNNPEVNNDDIISCGMDFDKHNVKYWLNGKIIINKNDENLSNKTELLPIFQLSNGAQITINFAWQGMKYLNEFCYRSLHGIFTQFNCISYDPTIQIMDQAYPIKVAAGRCHIFRENNRINCISASDKTIICANFYLKAQNNELDSNNSIYFEVRLVTSKKVKIGFMHMDDIMYANNNVSKESFIGIDIGQSLYYNSLKQCTSYELHTTPKPNDVLGVYINLNTKRIQFILNGIPPIGGDPETHLYIKQSYNLYPAFFIGKNEELSIIFDREEMTYLNQFICTGINIINNENGLYYDHIMNNKQYEIDNTESDIIKTIAGEVIKTCKKNKITIKSKKESIVVSSFKIKLPAAAADDVDSKDSDDYKFYYECKLFANYVSGIRFGWVDCNDDLTGNSSRLEGKHSWSWCPSGRIHGRNKCHPLIYHDFGDGINSRRYPIQLVDRRENKQLSRFDEVDDETDSDSDIDLEEKELRQEIIVHKDKKWRFLKGDVVGCGIDLKNEEIRFWLNGIDLGAAITTFGGSIEGNAIRAAVSLCENQSIELRFDKDCMAYIPPNYQAINLLQTYYVKKSNKLSWMDILEDEIYEARNALYVHIKHIDLNPSFAINTVAMNQYYNLKLQFGEQQKDDTKNKRIRKKDNISKSIVFKEHYVFEDVPYFKSVKDSKYPKIKFRQCTNNKIKNGEIIGICDVKDGQFPLKIYEKRSFTVGIIKPKQEPSVIEERQTTLFEQDDYRHRYDHNTAINAQNSDDNKDESDEYSEEDEADFKIEPNYFQIKKDRYNKRKAFTNLFGEGTANLNMKYEFVLRPEIEKTTSFKLNCDLSSQTEYYYEILADGSSYYFVGWIDDECKPKQSDRRFTAGQDLHSWTLYSRGYKYHNNNLQSYGKRIQSNDVIGCYIDLNKKLCNFFINGKELGEIFKNNMVISGNIYPVFSIHGGCLKVMVNKQRIKYFKKVKMLYPNCKILDLGNKYFFKNTSHLIGELSLDTEYKKLSPLIGKCTKGHSLTKYDYTNTTKIRGRCIKCYYSSKLSYPRNNLFASFAEKAKSIEKKEEFEAHYIFSCDRCADYNLCSSCYVNEEISWYMIAERLKSMDSFKKKLLWHNLASLIGLENSRGVVDKSNRLKFFYYLIQEIRLEKQDKLSWILSWDAIYEVLNIENIINGEIKFDQFDENNIMNVYQNAEWFETKSHEYFSILHIYAGSPKNQIKDYVLSPNGYKMRLKSLNVEKQHKNGTHLCFICHDFRYMNYRKMSSTKKDRTFWISEKDESVMICYAHGCTYGDGAGGSIQQTKQWINTAYQLTLLLRELKIIIDDNEGDSAVNVQLDTLLSFNDESSSEQVNVFKHQFITCINRICKILSFQNRITVIELLTHHLPGLILFFIANLPNPVSLRNFFAKYVDPVLEDYYWTFTSRYSSINDKYFESETESLYDGNPYDEFDDIYVNLSDDKKCWSKFGDFLRTVPEDYKKLIPKSLDTPISDVMTIMKQDEIEALFNRFADDYFRYKKWRWNMVKTAENEKYIKSEIKNIVKMLIDDQANSDDSFKLNIDSFINDENWANAFVSYQHVKNKENKTNADDNNDEKYQTTAPEIELSELKTFESELTHFSLFTTNIDSEKIWFYFMFPDENEIRFRISTTSKLGVNNISFKFCSYDNPTMDEAVDFYENEEILYNDYWYDLKYNSSKYSVSLNKKIVKESIITKPKWIGIAIQTDLETHEHFVISSINFDDTLINSWMKRTKKIDNTDYVLLIDKIMSKRNNWFDPFESHIKDLFANYNVDVRKLENMSLFPQSQHAVEIRIKSFPYPLPPYILKEALKIDFSILSLLGSEFIVKKQIIYSKIKMHYKLYQYIMKCNEKEFHHKDENKKKKFLSHFYKILKLRQKRKETQSFIFLTHSDERIEEDKEREDDLENEEKYAADDYDMDVVNEMDINDAKYSLSYQEIILINKDFYKLLSEKVLTFESTDEMHHNYLLKASKNTLESLYCDPIWMWIDLFPARQQTLEINTDKLTNDGYCVVKCNFGVDTAILSNKPLPLINCGWTGKKMYYEMNIKNIGSSVTTKCSLGFVLEESFDTITSTTIPGKHPFSYGIDGDKGQLLISNKEQKDNYLEIPFSNDQTIGAGITIAKYDKNAQKKSYINYTFMHKDSSGSELKQYPVNKSLLPQDIMHTFYPFLSVGSKEIIVEINFGPTFNYKTMSDRIKQRVLGFKSKKDWTEDWADNTERIAIFDNLLKDVDDKTEKDRKNISKIREIESVMYKILETDLVRLTEVLLRIRVATDQLNKDSFDDNISEIDKKSISHSLYLLCIIYYILYLVDLKNLGREDWTKMNYLIGLNESGKAGFPYNLKNNIQLKKILKLQNKLKRQNNIKLFKSINEYSYELISIDNNIGNMGIRRKHVSNYSSADAPEPFTYLAKLASSNQTSQGQQYLLSLWKMISRDRLFNASQSSEQALKQEFLLDFIACFLSKPSKLKIITELINKWTNASQMLERDTSSFSYDYELKILVSGLIRSSRNPISTAIQTAIYLTNYSELFPDIEEDIMKVSVFCEENAVKYLADIQSNRLRVIALEANNTLVRSLDHGLETFIASNEVQFLKQLIWTNSSDTLLLNAIDAETFRDNTDEFSQWGITYFRDYINMFINWNNMKEFVFTINSTKNWFFSPIGKVQFESIVTTGHMLLVLYMATKLQSVYQSASMNGLEMLFHLINCNFFLSEINQIINDSRYTKEFTNFFDLASIVGYVGIFVLRLMVFLEIKVCPPELMATHCIDSNYNAVYLLVWCLTIASVCLRFVWLLFPFKTMGLMVTSMIKMIGDIINFIIFVFVFIVGFATVFYMSTGAQDGFDSWDGSFISIIYGMLDGMDNSDFQDQYANTYRELLINALVLFYVILAVVTLLNFLIAVMTQTYENVAGRAEIDVNIHRWKICYSHYDLPVLPAPFQAIPIILRIVLRYIIEPLLYLCFRKYVNHAWFVGKSFGLRSIHENDEVVGDDVGSDDGENDANIKTNEADNSISHHQVEHILITPFCMKSHIKNAGCWRRLKTIYYEMNAGQLPSNAQIENEYNFWICSYCLFINGEKNSSQEDVFNYYEYNNKQEPDFAFRDEDLKFIQTMEIDLCDNCFRPRQDCSRNEVWDSIFSFYIYHILSFLCLRLPLMILFFVLFVIIAIFAAVFAMFEARFCNNSQIKNIFMDWFRYYNDDIHGYEIKLVNPYQVYTALKKQIIRQEKLKENNKKNKKRSKGIFQRNFDEYDDEIATKVIDKIFEDTDEILDEDEIDLISQKYKHLIKNKVEEAIILTDNVDWNALNEFIKIIKDNTQNIANFVKDANRNLLEFIDEEEDDEMKEILEFTSQNINAKYTFTNSPVLYKMQNLEDAISQNQVVETENN